MDFRIADTFTDSLVRLTGDEQKSVKTTAFDLQLNPAHPSMSLHKLDGAKDKSFWSVRVSGDIRLIVHKTAASLLLCYVDHDDKAYAWAERRKLETHPKTGAAQWVEIRERVEEAPFVRAVLAAEPAPRAWATSVTKPLLFAQRSDDELLGFGVPTEWLADVRLADGPRMPVRQFRLVPQVVQGHRRRTVLGYLPPLPPRNHRWPLSPLHHPPRATSG